MVRSGDLAAICEKFLWLVGVAFGRIGTTLEPRNRDSARLGVHRHELQDRVDGPRTCQPLLSAATPAVQPSTGPSLDCANPALQLVCELLGRLRGRRR